MEEKIEYYADVTVKRSQAGLGLFAAENIKTDGLIVEYTGDRVSSAEADERGGRYLFEVTDDLFIDGSGRDNIARYINHSCAPNAEAEHETTEDRIYIRAARGITTGEEITIDYGKEYFADFIKPNGCRCSKCTATKSSTSLSK